MPFRIFDKLKNEIQIFTLRFCFLPQYEKRNSSNWVLFLCHLDFYFEFSMLSFVFHSHKNGKRNTVRFLFFIFMKELKNELPKKIEIFTSMIYKLFKCKFLSSLLIFSVVQSSHRHQESSV